MKGSRPDDSDSLPYGKLTALLKYRGLDARDWLDAHRGRMEALLAVRESMMKGVEDVSSAQVETARAMFDRLMTEMPELAQNGRYEEMARLQAELSAKMLDAMMANMRGISAVLARGNLDVLQVMGQAFEQTMRALGQKK